MKNYCRHCGVKLDPEQKHDCPKFRVWAKAKGLFVHALNYINQNENVENENDYYERDKAIIPDCVEPDNGEITVKQYDLAILRTRHKLTRAEGKLQITNKRLIFRATGRSPMGKTVYQSEFAMDKVDGVEIRRDHRFFLWDFLVSYWLSSWFFVIGILIAWLLPRDSVFWTVCALLLSLGSVVPFFTVRKKHLIKLLILSVGNGITFAIAMVNTSFIEELMEHGNPEKMTFLMVLGLVLSAFYSVLYILSMFMSLFKPNLVVEVKTSSGSPGIQIKYRYASFFIWKKLEENSGFSEILPGKDADLATKEIGAIINDIKTLGDIGVEKWKV